MKHVIINSISKKKTITIAEEFGVDVQWALGRRLDYLLQGKALLEAENDRLLDDLLFGKPNVPTEHFIALMMDGVAKELKQVDVKIKTLTVVPREGAITEDMIEAAREVPIESLIDFGRAGRTFAFCHDSDGYTLAKSRNSNTAWCHVCSKTFNPIDTLMQRDGFSFVDAVKQLS